MSSVPSVASVHAALIREVLAGDVDASWAAYARGWLDGTLQAGRLADPVFDRLATGRDWVRDAQAGAAAASQGGGVTYERARGLEDIAWAAEFLVLEKPEKARAFVISACRRLQVPFDLVVR